MLTTAEEVAVRLQVAHRVLVPSREEQAGRHSARRMEQLEAVGRVDRLAVRLPEERINYSASGGPVVAVMVEGQPVPEGQ